MDTTPSEKDVGSCEGASGPNTIVGDALHQTIKGVAIKLTTTPPRRKRKPDETRPCPRRQPAATHLRQPCPAGPPHGACGAITARTTTTAATTTTPTHTPTPRPLSPLAVPRPRLHRNRRAATAASARAGARDTQLYISLTFVPWFACLFSV